MVEQRADDRRERRRRRSRQAAYDRGAAEAEERIVDALTKHLDDVSLVRALTAIALEAVDALAALAPDASDELHGALEKVRVLAREVLRPASLPEED